MKLLGGRCYKSKDKKYLIMNNLEADVGQYLNKGIDAFLFSALFISFTFFIIFAMLMALELYKTNHYVNNQSVALFSRDVDHYDTTKHVEKVVSCYYNTPSAQNLSQLMPTSIDPNLCTHINIAFAQVKNKTIYMEESQYMIIKKLMQLKKLNPHLKILLSIGGAGNHDGFSDMVVDHASRKTFIKSIKNVLELYYLDGIDIDWEFPAFNVFTGKSNYYKRQRQHFSQLLREIRMEYIREKKNYLLTVAVAAQQIIVDIAYDVDQINLYTDFVNLMTYDYHFYTKFTPFTGLNSPLYARPSEQLYLSTLNINYTVALYRSKGLDASKIVLGIPTYGHTFTLVNMHNTNIGSPASGTGALGDRGFVNYPDICYFIQKYNISVNMDNHTDVPYIYNNLEWVSYDSPDSVIKKAEFIIEHNLRGAMIYSLNSDDFEGKCKKLHGSEKFVLTMSIKNALKQK